MVIAFNVLCQSAKQFVDIIEINLSNVQLILWKFAFDLR